MSKAFQVNRRQPMAIIDRRNSSLHRTKSCKVHNHFPKYDDKNVLNLFQLILRNKAKI